MGRGSLIDPLAAALTIDGGARGEEDPLRRLAFITQHLEQPTQSIQIHVPVRVPVPHLRGGHIEDEFQVRGQAPEAVENSYIPRDWMNLWRQAGNLSSQAKDLVALFGQPLPQRRAHVAASHDEYSGHPI